MAHLAMLCPSATGHLNPMCALGRALQRRGHRVSMFQIPDAEPTVRSAGLEYQEIGATDYPPGYQAALHAQLGKMKGLEALRWTVEIIRGRVVTFLREAPALFREAQIDGIVADQTSLEGKNLSEVLDIPFVSVANALLLNQEVGVPPYSFTWPYRDSMLARLRNRAAYFATGRIVEPLFKTLDQYRVEHGLAAVTDRTRWFSDLAQVGQIPAELDFPRVELPDCFHYTGSFVDGEGRAPAPFPFERLTGQPLIYASLGTLQNRLLHVFEKIAQACADLDAQLVVSLGGSASPDSMPALAGSPLVVGYAPQLDLIARSRLVITHAGMNTALESLGQGVPMVAIPITNDQPGVAARLAYAGAAEVVPLGRLGVERLRSAVTRALSDPSYAENARRLQAAIESAGGAARGAEIIEQAITTRRPVVNDRGAAAGGSGSRAAAAGSRQ